jgi:hypothetical protein
MRVAAGYRGRPHAGDALIPMLLLNPAMAYLNWAFQFQFLSSVCFMALFLLCAQRLVLKSRAFDGHLALLALLLTALCGMNGLILSAGVTAGLAAYCALKRRIPPGLQRQHVPGITALVSVQLALLSTWRPSAATTAGLEPARTLDFLFNLQASGFSVATFPSPLLCAALVVALLLATFVLLARRLRAPDFAPLEATLALTLLACEAMLASIALGRAAAQGSWNGGIAMHYGSLSLMLPLVCWIVVSHGPRGRIQNVVGLAALAVGTYTYATGVVWAREHVASTFDRQRGVERAMHSEADVEALVRAHALDFTWMDTAEARQPVIDGITVLRRRGYPHYRLIFDAPFALDGATLAAGTGVPIERLVTADQVRESDGWIESGDSTRSRFPGLRVLGTLRSSNADRGRLVLALQRGQHLYYRSGPVVTGQTLTVETADGRSATYGLPSSDTYTRIDFGNADRLPERFTVILRDDGAAWGQWLAIAVGAAR